MLLVHGLKQIFKKYIFWYQPYSLFAWLSVEPLSLQLNVHGGSSLQNRSKRFEDVVSEVPGPGAYNVSPASKKAHRAVTANVGHPGRPGNKVVSIWLTIGGHSTWVVLTLATFIVLCHTSVLLKYSVIIDGNGFIMLNMPAYPL